MEKHTGLEVSTVYMGSGGYLKNRGGHIVKYITVWPLRGEPETNTKKCWMHTLIAKLKKRQHNKDVNFPPKLYINLKQYQSKSQQDSFWIYTSLF